MKTKNNRLKKWVRVTAVIFVLVCILFSFGTMYGAAADTVTEPPGYKSFPDLNGDGNVDLLDKIYYGKIYQAAQATQPAQTAPPATASPEEKDFFEGAKNFFGKAVGFFQNIGGWLNPLTWFDKFWSWIFDKIADSIISLNNMIINAVSTTFFSNQYVTASLDFFKQLGYVIFGAGLIFGIYGEVEKRMHDEPVNFNPLVMNYLKGFIMLVFIQPAIIFANDLMFKVLEPIGLSNNLGSSYLGNLQSVTVQLAVVILVMLAATLIMFLSLLKRFATLYIQILLGYVYIFDVVKGNTNSIGEYVREIAAGIITFFLQMLMYRFGITLTLSATSGGIVALGNSSLYVGLIMLIGVVIAPSVLKKYGFSANSGILQKLSSVAILAGKFV